MRRILTAVTLVVTAWIAVLIGIRKLLSGTHQVGDALVETPTDDTRTDKRGAVKSVQGAQIEMPEERIAELWHPENLERLARTYWSFLSKSTLGLIKVRYTPTERYVTLIFPWLRLLTFQAPEYETGQDTGVVRWRIEKGLLVASEGRGGDGYLEIDVRRLHSSKPGRGRLHVEVSIANFYPQLSHYASRYVYANTQSRIHVLVTYGFLRRIARGDLDESVARKYETTGALT